MCLYLKPSLRSNQVQPKREAARKRQALITWCMFMQYSYWSDRVMVCYICVNVYSEVCTLTVSTSAGCMQITGAISKHLSTLIRHKKKWKLSANSTNTLADADTFAANWRWNMIWNMPNNVQQHAECIQLSVVMLIRLANQQEMGNGLVSII